MRLLKLEEGQFTKDYFPVTGGVYDIPQRLKEIDSRYFVMYNKRNQTYEIHVKGQESTYGCTLPYGTLDARALSYVREYSAQRTAQIAEEIERHNERIAQQSQNEYMDKANMKMKEAYRYLNNHESSEEIPKELIDA